MKTLCMKTSVINMYTYVAHIQIFTYDFFMKKVLRSYYKNPMWGGAKF